MEIYGAESYSVRLCPKHRMPSHIVDLGLRLFLEWAEGQTKPLSRVDIPTTVVPPQASASMLWGGVLNNNGQLSGVFRPG